MKKVLIVDDSLVIRQMLRKLLPFCGNMEIVGECNDGKQVEEFLYNHWVDSIILDYHMPHMNGAETAKMVKDSFNHIQILLHTSDAQAAVETENVDGILIKPAKLTDIATAIQMVK